VSADQVGEVEQGGGGVGVSGVGEAQRVVPAGEGGADGEGAGVAAAGVTGAGQGAAVPAAPNPIIEVTSYRDRR